MQPGECYHLYPRCVYEAFSEYQLPELLRTPLNSLCLQIKSLQLGSIGEFLSAALQPPEPLAVFNSEASLLVCFSIKVYESGLIEANLTIISLEEMHKKLFSFVFVEQHVPGQHMLVYLFLDILVQ